jgi:glycosyltransferase involved in cell wall biosynthesis
LKVLQITPGGFKNNIRGIHESVLCTKLKERSIEVIAITLLGDKTNNYVNVIHDNWILPLKIYDLLCPELFKLMVKNKFDIIHIHSPLWSTFPLQCAMFKKLFLGKPCIATTHSFYPDYQKSFLHSIKEFSSDRNAFHLIYGIRGLAFKFVDAIICLSYLEKEFMANEYNIPKRKLFVVPNSVDVSRSNKFYDFRATNDIKFAHLILYVGQLIDLKGIDYLLQAFDKIIKEKYNCGLIIVTQTNDKMYLYNHLERLGLSYLMKNIILINYHENNLSDLDLISIYHSTDIFVLPSLAESCPTVVLEAYAAKKPVISSCVGGVPEIVEDNKTGFLVPPKDPQALFEKIKILLENPEMRNYMGVNGYEKIVKDFNWDINVNKIIDIYNTYLEVES